MAGGSALHFGIAQVLDARGEYAEAAESLRQAANAVALAEGRTAWPRL